MKTSLWAEMSGILLGGATHVCLLQIVQTGSAAQCLLLNGHGALSLGQSDDCLKETTDHHSETKLAL